MHKSARYVLLTLALCTALTACSSKSTEGKKDKTKNEATVDDYVSVKIAESKRYSIETVSLEVVESEYADSKKPLKAVLKFTALKDDSDTVSLAYDV